MGEGGRSSREGNSRTNVSRRKRWEAQENLTKVGGGGVQRGRMRELRKATLMVFEKAEGKHCFILIYLFTTISDNGTSRSL